MNNIIENKIPNEFFITKGCGSSEYTTHAGSYHMALYDAHICDYNIQTYSSVLPSTSKLVTLDEIYLPVFGSELKTIMSRADGLYGEYISSGIIWAWMYSDIEMNTKIGGLVCELGGYFDSETLEKRLYSAHNDLHKRTYSNYILGEQNIITQSLTIDKRYGTTLVALCFVNYLNNYDKLS